MSAFLKMKKDRKKLAASTREKIQNDSNGSNYKDERIYYPERDSSGNGYAVIRFLMARNPDDLPYVKVFEHGFKQDGNWYIETCPTTIGEKCPVCEANGDAWAAGNKTVARSRKRTKKYYANIMVVSDSKNPENEGKVFLFKFGQAIFDILKSASNPEFEDEKPIDAFDMWDGANFKLKIVKKDGQTNYDRSEFADPSPLAATDEEIEAIWSKAYDLNEFVSEGNFKSYDKLAARFARVTGASAPGSAEDVPAESARSSRSTSRTDNRPTESDHDDSGYELNDSDDDIEMPTGVEDDIDDPVKWFEEQAS